LDIFTNMGVYIGPMNLNIPSIVSILILIGGGIYFALIEKISINKILLVFGMWLIILIPFVLISINNFGTSGLVAFREWIRLFTIFMIFLLSYQLINKNNVQKSLNMVFLSLVVPLSAGIYQLVTHSGATIKGIHRIYGTIAHPNAFAFYIVLFIGLTYWKLRTTNHKSWFFLLLLEIGVLLMTVSFNGYIMFGILAFFLFLKEKRKQKAVITLTMILFALMLLHSQQFQTKLERVKSINIERTIEEKEVVDSFSWRIVNWQNLLSLFGEKPFFGYGLHATQFINPWKTSEGIGYAPHNDFIRYLVETGVTGLFFYIILIVYTGYYLFREYRRCVILQTKILFYVLLGVFIGWQIGSLVGNFITGTVFQFYFWAVLGIALKSRKIQERQTQFSDLIRI